MSKTGISITRRALLKNAALPAAGAVLLPQTGWAQKVRRYASRFVQPLHLPVLSQPDLAFAFVGDVESDRYNLSRTGNAWTGTTAPPACVSTFFQGHSSRRSRWSLPLSPCNEYIFAGRVAFLADVLALGDAWERSYGDLEWRPLQAERPLPWYAMLHTQGTNRRYGRQDGSRIIRLLAGGPLRDIALARHTKWRQRRAAGQPYAANGYHRDPHWSFGRKRLHCHAALVPCDGGGNEDSRQTGCHFRSM